MRIRRTRATKGCTGKAVRDGCSPGSSFRRQWARRLCARRSWSERTSLHARRSRGLAASCCIWRVRLSAQRLMGLLRRRYCRAHRAWGLYTGHAGLGWDWDCCACRGWAASVRARLLRRDGKCGHLIHLARCSLYPLSVGHGGSVKPHPGGRSSMGLLGIRCRYRRRHRRGYTCRRVSWGGGLIRWLRRLWSVSGLVHLGMRMRSVRHQWHTRWSIPGHGLRCGCVRVRVATRHLRVDAERIRQSPSQASTRTAIC